MLLRVWGSVRWLLAKCGNEAGAAGVVPLPADEKEPAVVSR